MIHYLKKISLETKYPKEFKEIILGAGCFWEVEKKFWDLEGIFLTSVGAWIVAKSISSIISPRIAFLTQPPTNLALVSVPVSSRWEKIT